MSNEDTNPRIVGGYEIRNAVFIGDKELLLGVNMNDSNGHFYMTCYAERDFIIELYKDAVVSDSFLEIAEIFADRLKEQVGKTVQEQDKICKERKIITSEMCKTDIFSENLIGKILVVNADDLRPEYRTDINQIIFCKGGNGAHPEGRGTSIYGDYLATGQKCMFHRCDILGELKPEHYPEWAEKRINVVKEFYKNENVFEYGGLHFVGIGQLPTRSERNLKAHIMHEPDINSKIKNYTYDKFMEATKLKNCDIYMCIEDGKKYIPGINKMLQYTGEHKPLSEKPQLKVRPSKEAER